MPLTYQILPDIGLIFVRYWGVTNVQETMETFARCAAEPEFSTDQKHLVDLSRVVEYERAFPDLMKLQAQKAGTLVHEGPPTQMVYYAPTRISLTMARSILKSWDGLEQVVGLIAQAEDEALEMLGLDLRRFADLPMKTV